MNSQQISALSQIQAQAIVNARKTNGSPQQIQTQIQLQAQALVHAHTQAQIAAGIYKGEAPAKKTNAQPNVLTALTPTQLQQQQDLQQKQNRELEALSKTHGASPATVEQKKAEMDTLERAHKQQLEQLHASFRKQNAAAEYAGVKVTTVPNPTAGADYPSVKLPVPNPTATAPTTIPVPAPTVPTPTAPAPTPFSTSTALVPSSNPPILADPAEPTPSATSPQFLAKLASTLNGFWTEELHKVQKIPQSTEQDFKNHNDLPLARIKRIMKSDEDVRMISAEAPVLFAKACELFILELTLRSWSFSQHHKRRTLQKEDIREAIQRTDIFDFLVDVIQ